MDPMEEEQAVKEKNITTLMDSFGRALLKAQEAGTYIHLSGPQVQRWAALVNMWNNVRSMTEDLKWSQKSQKELSGNSKEIVNHFKTEAAKWKGAVKPLKTQVANVNAEFRRLTEENRQLKKDATQKSGSDARMKKKMGKLSALAQKFSVTLDSMDADMNSEVSQKQPKKRRQPQ